NPSVYGQAITLTAVVSPVAPGAGIPTGAVTFYDGVTPLGTVQLDLSGQATWTSAALGVGSHTISAVYAGDGSFASSTSADLTQTVDRAATTTALAASPSPALVGQDVVFTILVLPVAPGAGVPTGTVLLKEGDTVLGTA